MAARHRNQKHGGKNGWFVAFSACLNLILILLCFPSLWKNPSKTTYIFFYSILNVSAIVLANLCVSYIMTSQNEEAEELMRKIEKEEEQVRKFFSKKLKKPVIETFSFLSWRMKILIRKCFICALSTWLSARCIAPKATTNLAFLASSNLWSLTIKNSALTLGSTPRDAFCHSLRI